MLAGCETLHTCSGGQRFAGGVIYVPGAHNLLYFRKKILNDKLRSAKARESPKLQSLNLPGQNQLVT